MDHVLTQLPYALTAAAIGAVGYIVIGFTGSLIWALLSVVVILVILFIVWSKQTPTLEKQANM